MSQLGQTASFRKELLFHGAEDLCVYQVFNITQEQKSHWQKPFKQIGWNKEGRPS